MKVLVIVDMQNDFIIGPLGTPEAIVARDNLCRWIKDNITREDMIILTKDTHDERDYFNSQEGRNLPVGHCIQFTEGWRTDANIAKSIVDSNQICSLSTVRKITFGSLNLKEYIPKDAEEIIFCGLCTDICVVSNALIIKAAFPEIPISVIANCCAGSTPEKHEAALSVMESCQISIRKE